MLNIDSQLMMRHVQLLGHLLQCIPVSRMFLLQVLLDTMAVDREKKRLEQENEDLRTILKQYLDGISVNSDVMNNPLNPLMVVNQRLQLILQERDKARAMALKQQAAASS